MQLSNLLNIINHSEVFIIAYNKFYDIPKNSNMLNHLIGDKNLYVLLKLINKLIFLAFNDLIRVMKVNIYDKIY